MHVSRLKVHLSFSLPLKKLREEKLNLTLAKFLNPAASDFTSPALLFWFDIRSKSIPLQMDGGMRAFKHFSAGEYYGFLVRA